MPQMHAEARRLLQSQDQCRDPDATFRNVHTTSFDPFLIVDSDRLPPSDTTNL